MLSKVKKLFTIEIDYKNRIIGFDIMRGIGAMLVVYGHGRTKMYFFPVLNEFLSVLGFWLMDLFFVQSGFLIGMIIIKMYEKEKQFNFKTAYNFWIRRWMRTLPNYYFVLFLTTILWAVFDGKFMFLKLKYIAYLVFSQSAFTPNGPFLEESWSLCIEEWFYLIFPLTILIGHKILMYRGFKQHLVKRNILISLIVLFTFPLILRLVVLLSNIGIDWIEMSRMTFFRLDTIGYGILMAWINVYYKDIFIKYRDQFGIMFLVLIGTYFLYFYQIILPQATHQKSILSYSLIFILSGMASLCLSVYMRDFKVKKITPFIKVVTHLSITSYSIYIFHLSVVMFLIDKFFLPTNKLENVVLFIIYLIGSVLFSILVYKFYEHPMTEMRERLKR